MDILVFVLTLIGVIVAILALGYQRNQAEAARRQEETARETARRKEVGVAEWMRDLRDWASEAIEVLTNAVYASNDSQEPMPSDARRYVPQLSALIDRGRFFLPNQYTEQYGTHKLPAFRGHRHAALDPLVSALIVLEGAAKGEELQDYVTYNRRAVLRELQKELVSHIQQILDPEGQNRRIASIIKDSQVQAENLLGKEDVGFTTMGLVPQRVAGYSHVLYCDALYSFLWERAGELRNVCLLHDPTNSMAEVCYCETRFVLSRGDMLLTKGASSRVSEA